MVNTELNKEHNATISLNDNNVRKLAQKPSGIISMADLRGKSTKPPIPERPEDCDYYFEAEYEFESAIPKILQDNNNDLSKITIGFGDEVEKLFRLFEFTSITKTPRAFFGRNIISATYTFNNCKSLTSISEGLFYNCPNVVSFIQTFGSCESLTTIPNGLFDKCPNVTNFDGTFNNCKSLTAIPEGLFDKCPNVRNFGVAFMGCESLTAIPNGLFDKSPNVVSFYRTFDNCKSLTAIPEELFAKCLNVTNFQRTFSDCESLKTIPEGLFDKCPNVTRFDCTFLKCVEIISDIPDAWNTSKHHNVTEYKEYAFNCTKAKNYASIPSGWK